MLKKTSFAAVALAGCAQAAYFYNCSEVAFCQRYRDFEYQQLGVQFAKQHTKHRTMEPQLQSVPWFNSHPHDHKINITPTQYYAVDASSWQELKGGTEVQFNLNLTGAQKNSVQAEKLTASLKFYEGGIMRLNINEVDGVENRFKISSEPNFAIMEDQLQPFEAIEDKDEDQVQIQTDTVGNFFVVKFSPFRVESFVDDELVMTLNENDTLYFEKSVGHQDDICMEGGKYAEQIDYQQACGMGALFETTYMYGLSERESSLLLSDTTKGDPYRFFNIDYYMHQTGDARGEYGSIPYITGHDETNDASLLWVNSSDTWTDLVKTASDGVFSNFVSESGQIELFLFASDSPKKQLKNLAEITGHAPLPPIQHLGYHFSKYDEVSADIMMQRDNDFEEYNFPVDVYWMDILYAQEYEYFTFDHEKFPAKKLELMNHQIASHKRALVAITDPHIAAKENNWVYTEGVELEEDLDHTQIFIHDCNNERFEGECWPGNSVWVDFINENAQTFWKGLYQYKKFKGTTQIYSFWNDMNEPSVFESEEGTMPLQMQHKRIDGTVIKHRDVHNAYGSLQHRATHQGVLARDGNKRRSFVLTRSFFIGSQKYGAYWTGDNVAVDKEPQGAIYTVLSSGLSGMFFGGADIPGYQGVPTQDLYIQTYQLGMFYPFFRAHCSIDNTEREPWLQTQRVQDAIREAVFYRYNLIHYLYTAFDEAATEGTPIMRPMFLEFPQEDNLFSTATQFMFGNNILVSPKLKTPFVHGHSNNVDISWSVSTELPQGAHWYNMITSQLETRTSFTAEYEDSEIPMWARAGSIIPILNHKRELSLDRAIMNPIRLDIYSDAATMAALGQLVIDDGISTSSHKSTFTFTMTDDGTMYLEATRHSNFKTTKYIDEVVIYGVPQSPDHIKKPAHHIFPTFSHKEATLPFEYDIDLQKVTIRNLKYALKLTKGTKDQLFKIVYPEPEVVNTDEVDNGREKQVINNDQVEERW